MFERDKEDLRDLGIPMETGIGAYDDEIGYRVVRSDYALPDIHLEPDEAAAVGLAARMWSSATLGGPATRALRKLEAAGVEVTPLPEGLQPRADSAGGGAAGHRRRRAGGPPAPVRLPRCQRSRSGQPAGRAVGDGLVAGPVVPRRSGPRPRGPAGVPAVADRGRAGGRGRRRRCGGPRRARPDGAGVLLRPAGHDAQARLQVRRDRGIGLRRQAVDVAATTTEWDVDGAYADAERLAEQVLAVRRRRRDPVARGGPRRAGPPAPGAGRRAGMSGATDAAAPAAGPGAVAAGPSRYADPADRGRSSTSARRRCAATSNCSGCAGCPGTGPGDLMDVVWQGDRVTLSNADDDRQAAAADPRGGARPGRRAPRAVRRTRPGRHRRRRPGPGQARERRRGGRCRATGCVAAPETVAVDPVVMTAVTDAVARGRRLHLTLLGTGPRRGHRA